MWRDPIVAEIREIREKYAARYNHDLRAIWRAAVENQKKSGERYVSFPQKPPVASKNSHGKPDRVLPSGIESR
jgi:hypothetical protein